jgi:6,7-dimethyl-8-ribityllumazine synthase
MPPSMASPLNGVRIVEGSLDAGGMKIGLVVARFNAFITDRLLDGAVDALVRSGASASDLVVVRVPGCWELPQAARALVDAGGLDAVVGLGCLMRGDTIHFDLIAGEATKGLAALAQSSSVVVTFGVLTTDSLEQAVHRAGAKHGNKGAEAAMAAVEMVAVRRALSSASSGGTSRRTTKRARG